MKTRFLLLPLMAVVSFSAFAQGDIKKGSRLIGGDVGFSTSSSDAGVTSSSGTSFNVSPVYGKAVKDNFFIGSLLRLSYGNNKNENSAVAYKSTSMSWYGGVFVRKYKPLKNGFYLFLQAGAGGGAGKSRQQTTPSADFVAVQKSGMIDLNLTPGFAYNLTKKLQLETGLRSIVALEYSWQKNRNLSTNQFDQTSRLFRFNSSLNNFTSQLYLGFRVMLSK